MKKNILLKLVAFCMAMVLVRVLKTGHMAFLFMFWNLLLAWLPYWFMTRYKQLSGKWNRAALMGLSILFLPNAPYILTDLFHLRKDLAAPIWFDLVMLAAFSMIGLLLFLVTVEKLLENLRPLFRSEWQLTLAKALIFISNGYGIYLGRYLRLNSWYIVSEPGTLLKKMFYSLNDYGSLKESAAITGTFTIFLYLVFEIYESLKHRVGERQHELP